MRPWPAWKAVTDSNSGAAAFRRWNRSYEKKPQRSCGPPCTQQLSPSPMRNRVAGSLTGSDFSITACISVKMAVVPPMPRARVRTAVAVKTRAEPSLRRA